MKEPIQKPGKKLPAKKKQANKTEPVVRTVTVGSITSTQPVTYENLCIYPKVTTSSTLTRVKSVNVTIVFGEG